MSEIQEKGLLKLAERIKHFRAVQKGVKDVRGKFLLQRRIDLIKGSITRHTACSINTDIVTTIISI